MKAPSLLAFVLPTVVSLASAQTPDNLIGITRMAPSLRQQSHTPCALLSQCLLPGMPPAPPQLWAGGAAWDPVRSGAWVTNGVLLGKYDDTCVMQCGPIPLPFVGAATVMTGLELVERVNQLWGIDSAGNLHFFTNACPPAHLGQCNTGLLPTALGNVTSGLAVDELQGLVFIAHPVFPLGMNRIVVSLVTAPCQPVAQFFVPTCFTGFGAVTGLACDWGNQILYATDGTGTVAMNYTWLAPTLTITGFTCCGTTTVVDPLIGLAIRPGRATSVGQPCANGTCPPCPQIHSLANDPVLGNTQFRLALDQAPQNAFAIAAIAAGPCMAPGIGIPPLCGPLYTWPLLGTLGPNLTGGFAPCSGATTFNLPLPVGPGLAGLVFSSQCVTLCLGGGGGFGMSNCLSWQLQGN